jgi:hypothetical protein
MGLARVLLDITALILFIFVGIPLIVMLMGFLAPIWYGMYEMTLHGLGPTNPLTQLMYFIYSLSQYAHTYMFSSNSSSNSSGGGCQ